MRSPLQTACLVLCWFAIVAGTIGLIPSGMGVSGVFPAPSVVDLAAFISAAVIFGVGLISLTILDSRHRGCLFFSWFAIVAGVLGLIRHSLDSFGFRFFGLATHTHEPSHAPLHWTACIACAVVFGAGLISLTIIADRRTRTSNAQAHHEN